MTSPPLSFYIKGYLVTNVVVRGREKDILAAYTVVVQEAKKDLHLHTNPLFSNHTAFVTDKKNTVITHFSTTYYLNSPVHG